MLDTSFSLPAAMEPYRQKLIETALPCLHIRPRKAEKTTVFQSKVGGQFYWPAELELPKDATGKPLFPLAQINFSETPKLAGFPEKGILQFWIADDDSYGADFDDLENRAGYRVVFFENLDENEEKLRSNWSFLQHFGEMPVPTDRAFLMDFEAAEEIAPPSDKRFFDHFGEQFFDRFGEQCWDVEAEFDEACSAPGAKVGGYAFFAQEDPRFELEEDWLLLFQLDSDDELGWAWGDSGVANFFIRPEDLAARDFSSVVYNWDCY